MPDRPVSSLAARTCRGVLLAAFATALTACAPHRTFEDEVFSANRAVRDAVSMRTFSTDEPIELKTSGALAVDVDNFAGDVTIRADRKVDRTYVEVRRVATHGLGRWIESKDALDDAGWTASLEPRDGGGETLSIRTDTPNPEKYFHHMEIVVVTPALDSVKVRSTKGDVTVIDNRGSVDIETTRGDVRMMTPWPMTGPMTIVTSEGSIDYRVRGESKGVFDCESRGGEVRQRAEFGKWIALNGDNDHDRFLAVLNDGTNPVVLRTSEKNIRVAIVPDPTAVGIYIVD
ncbi:MAG: DUF4097 family beta strand repeat-containing protein [Planctomycetota bacterium]|jgi:hypothetical protein|nr:DUF4097 family beta strand repeat-containing protein [Planctomycetota bacterium]